ncbi:MAG: hypothetical protein MZW92_59965 [Comamonadaceae bacterium]|nr:hypothetical protein [Comamonadaceae bacterium]
MLRCVTLAAALASAFAPAPPQVPRSRSRQRAARRTRRHAAARGAAQRPAGAAGAGRAHPRRRTTCWSLSGALAGQQAASCTTRARLRGQLHDVWMLTPAELRQQPWPTHAPRKRAAWRFDPLSQTWSRP